MRTVCARDPAILRMWTVCEASEEWVSLGENIVACRRGTQIIQKVLTYLWGEERFQVADCLAAFCLAAFDIDVVTFCLVENSDQPRRCVLLCG